jgi:predicted HTH transcriptional regulator
MDPSLLENLLYQEESESLDFKSAQYPFAKATNAEKAELLKDILAFANAWRQSDARILIGVEEVRGARSNVNGIDPGDHLLDRNLQQFVSKRPTVQSHSHTIHAASKALK